MTLTRTFSAFSRTFGGSVILAAAILAAVLAGPAKANGSDVVLGNLGANGTNPVSPSVSFSPGLADFAFGFVAGTDPNYLDLVSASFGLSGAASPTVTADLYSNASGVPGSQINSLGTASVGSTAGLATFTPGSPITLTASETYWIVLSAPSALNWHSPYGNISEQNSSTWGNGGLVGKQLDGTNWTDTLAVGSTTISAVPEPGTIMLLATAVAAVGGGVLRRRMKAAAKN